MPYVILCYRDERVIDAASREREAQIEARLDAAVATLVEHGVISLAISLLASTTSTTLRLLRGAPFVCDGPAVESGLQLQHVYLADCGNLDDALAVAGRLAVLEPGGVYEVRPTETIKGRGQGQE